MSGTAPSERPRTLLDKVWDAHAVRHETPDAPGILYVDMHLVHEVTSPQAFATLAENGLTVRRPDRTLATIDHSIPTRLGPDGALPDGMDAAAGRQIEMLTENCRVHGIECLGVQDPRRGIVHVVGPELGATRPGSVIVCGDSHTSTHGAFGALAFGIGTTEVAHTLATQCILQRKPKCMAIEFVGVPPEATSAKDLALAMTGALGMDGGTGHVLEFRGEAVERLSMEGRMTLCNMSIEAGARAGVVAPDATTFDWLEGRPKLPDPGSDSWRTLVEEWCSLRSEPGASFDRTVRIDVSALEPQITWGTNPGAVAAIGGAVPSDADSEDQRTYVGWRAGDALTGRPIDVVFIGSCTNGRLEDLRAAAAIVDGRRVADRVRMLVVPGSEAVKAAAEAEGLDRVFIEAGAEWREPGCSMCIAMNGDVVAPGELAVSTSNRNFRGRQGPGSRTLLAGPATAAASAVRGAVADPRTIAATPAAEEVGHA